MSAREATRAIRTATVYTHSRPDQTADAVAALRTSAERAGV